MVHDKYSMWRVCDEVNDPLIEDSEPLFDERRGRARSCLSSNDIADAPNNFIIPLIQNLGEWTFNLKWTPSIILVMESIALELLHVLLDSALVQVHVNRG